MQNKLEIAVSIISALFPALAIYNFLPGTNLGSFILMLCWIPLLWIRKNNEYNYDEVFFLFCILFISVFSCLLHLVFYAEWFDFTLFTHNMYSILMTLIPLCFITKNIKTEIFVKSVIIMGVLSSIVISWQWMMLFFTGSFQKDVFLPGLDIIRDVKTFSNYRPCSFFTEPAHFAIYMLPAFQLALLYKKKVLIYLFALSILFSGSSTGIILLGVLISLHIYIIGKKKWHTALMFFIIAILSFYIIFMFFPDIFFNASEKIISVKDGESSNRLLGPLEYFSLFQYYEHFCGITLNQLSNLLAFNHFYNTNGNYANAIIYSYISFGIIGFILFLTYIIKKFRSTKSTYAFLLIFLGVLSSDQILFNRNYFFLALFVLMDDEIYKYVEKQYQ